MSNPVPACMGVYGISSFDGRWYVGGSNNIRQRWAEHRSTLKHGKHHSQDLQAVFDLRGLDGVEIVVLEVVTDPSLLREREQHHMDRLSAVASGFNIEPKAVKRGMRTTDEVRARISVAKTGKKQRPGRRQSDEWRRKIAEGRSGDRNWRAKVTSEDVRAIRHAASTGTTARDLAARYGIHPTSVAAIVSRKTWASVA